MEHEYPIRLLSISMDVSDSTKAKAQMKKRAKDKQELNEWYQNYYHELLWREYRLYSALFQPADGEIAWSWRKTFVVKGIGDEIWLLYSLDDESSSALPALFRRFLHAAQDIAMMPILGTPPRDDGKAGDESLECRLLPLKFYVDVIEHAIEINGIRREFLIQKLPDLLDPESDRTTQDVVDLGNRLHAAHLQPNPKGLLTSFRTDYIGWEVDRFFRTTKFALPNVVTVGQALFEEVVDTSKDSEKGIGGTCLNRMTVEFPTIHNRGRRSDRCFFYLKRGISSEGVKGLGEGYTVYHVMRKSNLLELHHTDISHRIMEDTFEAFTLDLEAAVRELTAN